MREEGLIGREVGEGRFLFEEGQSLKGKGQIGECLGRAWDLCKGLLNRVLKILRGQRTERGAEGGVRRSVGRGLVCKLH